MAPLYEYTPFPPDTDQIRLLTLFPSREQNEEIVITLRNSTTKAAARQYEALSYVWGSIDNPETISVFSIFRTGAEEDDVSCSVCDAAPLLVTQNLAVALRHLRRQDVARILWIDAICIDQQNIAERSEQVGKMAQIYNLAARVVIWLGPASPDSDLAMRLVEQLGQVLRVDERTRMITLASNGEAEPHWADTTQPLPYGEDELCALKKLFWRSWFERLWVVQEVMISIDAVMICGRQEAAWQSVMVAVRCLITKSTKMFKGDELVSRLHHINNLFDPKFNNTIHTMVRLTRGLKCTDDRDRIYACLSLDKNCGNMKPDYSLSTIQAYRNFAALSMSRNEMEFLAECEHANRRLAGPSWIPDWTVKRVTAPIHGFNAAAMAHQLAFESQAEGFLRVSAVPVGTVVDVDIVSFSSSHPIPLTREIVRIVPAEIESLEYKTGCSLMEAFSGTLICSGLEPRVPQTQGFRTPQQSMHGLRTILRCGNGVDFEHTRDDQIYLSLAHKFMSNRSVVRTDQGYIGLAPSDVKEGDIILAILSCTSFTAARPAPGNEGRYNVVGEAFLYGLTNGEAVLGPLPKHVQAEYHRHPDERVEGYCEAYRDTKTGEVSWIDPRLEALGNPVETDHNGRPFAVYGEALEKAGIRLSQVELV